MKKLSNIDLLNLLGGVSREEYCATLSTLIANNWGDWDKSTQDSAAQSWSKHCA